MKGQPVTPQSIHPGLLRLATLALALLLAACDDIPLDPDSVRSIESTTSFGFCLGYCRTTLTITSREAVLLEESTREPLPARRTTAPVTAEEWQRLVDAIDPEAFEGLPAVVGCPDCADGGAESLEVIGDGLRERVEFEFGANLPELQPLLDRVRAVRQRVDAQ